jgi:uncharacterized protein (DUF1697 family)
MRTHVALLRGINLASRNRVAMPVLREIAADLGHFDAATHVQSGNLVLRARGRTGARTLATELRRSLADATGVDVPIVVLTARQWREMVAANPFPDEQDGTELHVLVRQQPVPAAHRREAEALRDRLRAAGSRDDLAVEGRAVYLHLPDGLGRSELYLRLGRARSTQASGATARNWRTVLAIEALLVEEV